MGAIAIIIRARFLMVPMLGCVLTLVSEGVAQSDVDITGTWTGTWQSEEDAVSILPSFFTLNVYVPALTESGVSVMDHFDRGQADGLGQSSRPGSDRLG